MKRIGLFLAILLPVVPTVGFWFWNHVKDPMGNQLAGGAVEQLLAYGRLAGLLAVLAVLFQIMLIGRVKWIETVFGHDRLVHLHRFLGLFLIVFLVSHPLLVNMGHSMQADVSMWEQFVDFCRNWEDVMAAVVGQTIFVIAIIMSILVMRKWLRYELWYYSHLSIYIAIALAFGHQLEVGSDFTSNRYFAAFWYFLYGFVFLNLLYYRFIRPLASYRRHRFAVAEVVAETDDVNSVYISGRDMERFRMAAGQFVIVRFWDKGFRWEAHPFSLSSLLDCGRIRLSIKALGDYTRRVGGIRANTPVIIDGPHGVFTAAHCHAAKVLLIGGGIGITPLRSLAEDLMRQGREVILLYSSRKRSGIVFEGELARLEQSSNGRFKVFHVLSDDPDWSGENGRIDAEKISRLVPDLPEREIFLCGPPQMMKGLRKILAGLGVGNKSIHYEKFTL